MVKMVAGAQSSTSYYPPIRSFLAFTFLATISFILIFVFNPGHNDLMPSHQRRSLIARQDDTTTTTTTSLTLHRLGDPVETITPTSISASSTSIPNSITTSQTSHVSSTTTLPPPPTSSPSSSRPPSSSTSTTSSVRTSRISSIVVPTTSLSSSSSFILPSSTPSSSIVVPTTTDSPLSFVPFAAATTLVMTNSLNIPTGIPSDSTQPQPSESPSSTPAESSSSSSAFWNNKAAVVSTFIIVAVAICGAIGLGILFFLKKRNSRMERELHEELFEKYTDTHRIMSPTSSINGAPIDPFASDHDLRVKHNQQSSVDSHHSSQRGYHSTEPIQHPDFYDKPMSTAPFNDYPVTSSAYLPPSQAMQAATKPGAPSAFRNPAQQNPRASYQPSVDSFYGGIAQGPSTGYIRP